MDMPATRKQIVKRSVVSIYRINYKAIRYPSFRQNSQHSERIRTDMLADFHVIFCATVGKFTVM